MPEEKDHPTEEGNDGSKHHGHEHEQQDHDNDDDDCYKIEMDTADVIAPKYQPILFSGEEDDDEDDVNANNERHMLGYAAYHGPKFIPAEVKDNVEHFLANNNKVPLFLQKWLGDTFLGRHTEG